jgi:hypothetical protein
MENLSYRDKKRGFALCSTNRFGWWPRLRPSVLVPLLALVVSTPGSLAAQSVNPSAQPADSTSFSRPCSPWLGFSLASCGG